MAGMCKYPIFDGVEVFRCRDGLMLDTKNCARFLGVSAHTLAGWRHQKIGPTFIKPGRVLYPVTVLVEWLVSSGRVQDVAEVTLPSPWAI
mgnify:FL=1